MCDLIERLASGQGAHFKNRELIGVDWKRGGKAEHAHFGNGKG